MIDLQSETLIPIAEATQLGPGRSIHLATIYRWFTTGVRGGIKLETVLIGGRRYTSREAIQRFVDRLSGPRGDSVQSLTSKQRSKAATKANDELAKAVLTAFRNGGAGQPKMVALGC